MKTLLAAGVLLAMAALLAVTPAGAASPATQPAGQPTDVAAAESPPAGDNAAGQPPVFVEAQPAGGRQASDARDQARDMAVVVTVGLVLALTPLLVLIILWGRRLRQPVRRSASPGGRGPDPWAVAAERLPAPDEDEECP